ncbi:hypothetical protein DW322_04060 [Rhodococcus rhodnii]|uniref:Uncharacterized protein n=2 Tax=Rhodococcus rhodnii TaxID=38312 RepID=R7WGX8_9NOCA|nr:NADH-quinone oxidoreductase subunit K [Rhodococcus rhodnii]EOM74318.1 hypothetical protein Rrhod_4462 [Rhodococcus rhodnii LMG 5362]TXG89548.1 hypothetical protein DW322_04060 [Rhodococcus rhodnii]
MTRPEWFLVLGVVLFVLGAARMIFRTDTIHRIVALNVAGIGTLVVLISIAADLARDGAQPDPVMHALVLTGIVITVSITGLALVMARFAERARRERTDRDETR